MNITAATRPQANKNSCPFNFCFNDELSSKKGFNFDNLIRNNHLLKTQTKLPTPTSTGTTIVGLVYKDGVVLGADTRATNGPIVADKNCEKIHYLFDNMYCCGAGTAADTEYTTKFISSQLELYSRNSNRKKPRVAMALTLLKQYLFKYQGQIGAALVLGGIDSNGPALYTIYPHGSTDRLPYVTMGSGSLAAMSVFESKYKPDLTKEEGITLVSEAIEAGIFNDLGSGSNVDICIIPMSGSVEVKRNYKMPNAKQQKTRGYKYKCGITPILKEEIFNLVAVSEEKDSDKMEVE